MIATSDYYFVVVIKCVRVCVFVFACLCQEEAGQNTAPDATESSPVKRRGRPPKTAVTASPVVVEKEGGAAAGGGAGRGRKRPADLASDPSAESINMKMSKQQQQKDEGVKRQIDLQR